VTTSTPAAATTSAPATCQRWRPPQRVRHGEEALAPVLIRGRGQDHPRTRPPPPRRTTSCTTPQATSEQRGLRWPAAQGVLQVQRTCAQRDRRPYGGRVATLCLAVGGSTKTIKAKEMEPQHGSLPTPKSWGARDGAVAQPAVHLHKAGEHPPPPQCWRKKQEGASPPRTSLGGRR
jgi:hypothetical protein